jgi:hypothetical protein
MVGERSTPRGGQRGACGSGRIGRSLKNARNMAWCVGQSSSSPMVSVPPNPDAAKEFSGTRLQAEGVTSPRSGKSRGSTGIGGSTAVGARDENCYAVASLFGEPGKNRTNPAIQGESECHGPAAAS